MCKNGPNFCQLVIPSFQKTSKFPLNLFNFRQKLSYFTYTKLILSTTKVMVTMYSAELRSLFCINFQFEMQVATSLRISIWHSRIKFTFAFRNEKIESICGIQVYCKDLRGAYCYNYNLNMFVQNTYLQQVRRDLTFKLEIKIVSTILTTGENRSLSFFQISYY